MWNAINNVLNDHQIMDTMIQLGSAFCMLLGTGVMVSLILGAPVPSPVRRKR